MTKRQSLPRRMALALVEHAAWVLPSARGPWAKAMRHELRQIENDLEALAWAGGCLVAGYVERGRTMLTRQWMKTGLAAFLAAAAIGAASWWAGQRPYLTPGNHQVFREESNAGALAGFLLFWPAAAVGVRVFFAFNDRRFHDIGRTFQVCAVIAVPYLPAVVLASLLTPGTVVNIGDSYCYDLWCLGVNQVNAAPRGQDVLYTADVRVFVDSSHPQHLPAGAVNGFFYVLDDRGRRYPVQMEAPFVDAEVTVQPGESVKSSLAILAPPNARKLYLVGYAGGRVFLPWLYLYFGSDISLFHRPARLRIL